MIYCKYSFPSKSQWDTLIPLISQEGSFINCAVSEIGHICLQENWDKICTSWDPNYTVDIMWYSEVNSNFDPYEVFPKPPGVRTFAGCEGLYVERYNSIKNQ
jgi:hypothetical protein